MNPISSAEKVFWLKDVLQISVLTHAPVFQHSDWQSFLSDIKAGEAFAEEVMAPLNRSGDLEGVSMIDGQIRTPEGFREAWAKIRKSGWIGISAIKPYQRRKIPQAVAMAIQESFFAANPALYFYLLSTIETAKLIEQFGVEANTDEYCQRLFTGEWTGAFALDDLETPVNAADRYTLAEPGTDGYRLSGTKINVVAGSHDFSGNQIHIVQARIPGHKDGLPYRFGLFFVPVLRLENNRLIDNQVRIQRLNSTSGIRGVPVCTIRYGQDGDCRGYPLIPPVAAEIQIACLLEGFRLQLTLLGVAQSDKTVLELQKFHPGQHPTAASVSPKRPDVHPMIPETVLLLKALNEGMRGAVYSAAFFSDCERHGGKKQKKHFADLVSLYTVILKVYVTDTAMELIQSATKMIDRFGFKADSSLHQLLRDMKSGLVLGGDNAEVTDEFLWQVLTHDNGKSFQTLVNHFQALEMHLAQSEALNEAIGILKDYIGGLILLVDDIMAETAEKRRSRYQVHAGRILKLFGEVMIAYHLVQQGLEAEKVMREQGINFYNLRQEVLKNSNCIKWYNKLIVAEYFTRHVLSLQESVIHLIQQNPRTVFDFLPDPG